MEKKGEPFETVCCFSKIKGSTILITINEAKRLIKRVLLSNVVSDKKDLAITPLISGKHGIGKSQMIKSVADDLGGVCITIEGGTLKEGEITGLPYQYRDDSGTVRFRFLPYYAVVPGLPSPEVLTHPVVLANLLFLGCLASMVCFLTWNWCISKLGAVKATNWVYFNPISTMIFASWVLGEKITPYFLAGAACILIGMYTADRKTE